MGNNTSKKSLLFAHDHIFIKSADQTIYSPGGFPSSLWDKYLNHVDEITVISRYRIINEKEESKHIVSSRESVRFSFVPKISDPINLIKNKKTVKNIIENEVSKTDFVIARLPSENGLLAVKYALKHSKPLCIELVGCVFDSLRYYGNLLSKIYMPLAYFRTKRAVLEANHVLYVTEKYLQNRYPANDNAKIVNASNVKVDMDTIVSERNIELGNKVVLGIIGNYKTKYKGIKTAILALSKLSKVGFNLELRVLGDGDRRYYKSFAKSKGVEDMLKLYDPLPSGSAVMKWLDGIDIYLQPSLTEGLPRALVEAMARGCITIGSNAGGIPELLEPARIHKKGSQSDLASKIQEMLGLDKKELLKISQSNLNTARGYTYEIVSARRRLFFESFFGESLK